MSWLVVACFMMLQDRRRLALVLLPQALCTLDCRVVYCSGKRFQRPGTKQISSRLDSSLTRRPRGVWGIATHGHPNSLQYNMPSLACRSVTSAGPNSCSHRPTVLSLRTQTPGEHCTMATRRQWRFMATLRWKTKCWSPQVLIYMLLQKSCHPILPRQQSFHFV